MQLARHSDPKLTMAVYGRAELHDLASAVERLPCLMSDNPKKFATLTATGTAGEPVGRPDRALTKSMTECAQSLITLDTSTVSDGSELPCPNPLDSQAVENDC